MSKDSSLHEQHTFAMLKNLFKTIWGVISVILGFIAIGIVIKFFLAGIHTKTLIDALTNSVVAGMAAWIAAELFRRAYSLRIGLLAFEVTMAMALGYQAIFT